ncbi:MAG: GNAT family N-acetyltransferase [Actinobacteria bacterium HGW-Actinobacteria-4]|nr:MAG: GNAT family N-acetyltransferase [Actinobacteria bacterium HGW-Actinobacteria-4]
MITSTERLVLRKFRETDADAVHAYASDPEVCKYTDFGPNTWEDTVNFVNTAMNHEPDSLADLAIALRSTREVIGGTGAFLPKGEEPDERPHVREIGYVLRRDLWGQGLVTEAATALISLLKQTGTVTRIEARCRPENLASARVMQKLGMKFEFLLERDYECKGVWVDSHLYSLDLRAPRP